MTARGAAVAFLAVLVGLTVLLASGITVELLHDLNAIKAAL